MVIVGRASPKKPSATVVRAASSCEMTNRLDMGTGRFRRHQAGSEGLRRVGDGDEPRNQTLANLMGAW